MAVTVMKSDELYSVDISSNVTINSIISYILKFLISTVGIIYFIKLNYFHLLLLVRHIFTMLLSMLFVKKQHIKRSNKRQSLYFEVFFF